MVKRLKYVLVLTDPCGVFSADENPAETSEGPQEPEQGASATPVEKAAQLEPAEGATDEGTSDSTAPSESSSGPPAEPPASDNTPEERLSSQSQ